MMRRVSLAAGVALTALLTLAAACSGTADEANTVDSGSATTTGSDTFDGTIRLGATISETGEYAAEGTDSRQGYDTWLTWVNDVHGGVRVGDGRYRAEIVYHDDGSDADAAASGTQQLIDDGVDFLLGPYSSGLTATASAVAEANNVLMVEGNGTSDTLFERGFQNLFSVATVASDYTRSGIEELAAWGPRTAVVAHEDTSFATSVAQGAVRHLEANGIEVLAVEAYPRSSQDVSAIMTRFRDLDPDLFVGGGHYNDAVLFVESAKDLSFEPDGMLITVGPSNPKLTADLGADAEGVIGPTQWESSMAYEGPYFGTASDYAEYYESLWGRPPVYQAASATAAALALHLAIEAAGSTDTDEVRAALRELSADSFYGPISFDEQGVNVSKPTGVVQIQDGTIVVVAPQAAATGQLQYPLTPQ